MSSSRPEDEESKSSEASSAEVVDSPIPYATRQGRNEIFNQIKNNEYTEVEEKKTISSLIKDGDFVKAIDALHVLKDEANGINSKYVKLNGNNNQQVLLRDATEQNNRDYKDTYHSWAIMGLNYFNAAKKLLLAHGKEIPSDLLNYFNENAKSFFEKISKNVEPEVQLGRMVNSVLVPCLANALKISKKKVEKQLAEVKDFCNFDHLTISVATLTSVGILDKDGKEVKKIIVLHIDVPMCGNIDDTLQKQYEDLALYHKSPSKELEEEIEKIAWYKDQPNYIKSLIASHADPILNGKMIPTQLRKYLPGLRNAGEERLIDVETGDLIYSGYHSGNPGHLLGKGKHKNEVNQLATDQSVGQLARLIGVSHINIQTLLSPVNRGFSDDADLATQVSNAVRHNNEENNMSLHHSNTALNPWRRAGFNWATNIINAFGRKLEPNFKIIGADILWSHAKGLVKTEKVDQKTFDKLQVAIAEYEKLRSGSSLFDSENANLSLVSAVKVMAHMANQVSRALDQGDLLAEIDPCQSGKDRQGLARIKAHNDALMLHITGSISPGKDEKLKKQEQNIRHRMAQSGQVRKQAGLQGGTLGAEGIKTDTTGAVPASWIKDKKETPIIEKTASYNKKIPKNPDKAKRWYKNPKFWLGAVGLLIGMGLCATGIGALVGAPLVAATVSTLVGATMVNIVAGSSIAVGALAVAGTAAGLKKAKSENKLAVKAKRLGENPYSNYKPVKISRSDSASDLSDSESESKAPLLGSSAGIREKLRSSSEEREHKSEERAQPVQTERENNPQKKENVSSTLAAANPIEGSLAEKAAILNAEFSSNEFNDLFTFTYSSGEDCISAKSEKISLDKFTIYKEKIETTSEVDEVYIAMLRSFKIVYGDQKLVIATSDNMLRKWQNILTQHAASLGINDYELLTYQQQELMNAKASQQAAHAPGNDNGRAHNTFGR
ncbi:MAG: hypothetical protein P4M12_05845 [Gammaproteobacteria bacterium]|nr:hypothetical protein [Gammaproteobacteria bacterium]